MSSILARVGRFSAGHRLVVVAAWIVLVVALGAVVARSSHPTSSSVSVPASQATTTLQTVTEKFPDVGRSAGSAKSLTLVVQTKDGSGFTNPAATAEVTALLDEVRALQHVQSVSDPFAPTSPYVSADKTTAVSTVTFSGLTTGTQEGVYHSVLRLADEPRMHIRVEVGGELFPATVPIFGPGELIGVLVAFLVLFLTFGAMRVGGANMLVAVSGVAVGTLGVLAFGAIHPIQPTTLTLGSMLGLALGIDYSLFILTRFRTELREGGSVLDAVGRAVGTAGTAVVFAGLTVIIALAALTVVQISVLTEMGLAGAFGVLIAVLMALTLLPVLMRSLGRRVLSRRERHNLAAVRPVDVTRRPVRFIERWANFVVRQPLIAIVGAVVVVVICSTPVLSLKTASNVPGGDDPTSTERHAYNLVLQKFGGVQSPLLVLVTGSNAGTAVPAVIQLLQQLDGVQMVVPGAVTPSGDAALVTIIPRGGPLDDRTKALVGAIRDRSASVAGVRLEVTGEAAIGIDGDNALHHALIEYIVIIVALSFVLLTIMFRSLLIPLVATLGFLLSVGVSFGASVAVFQWGWFDALVPAPQGDPMISILPVILVGVLFGLAMDYQVFLVSRIHEMHRKGLTPKDAVTAGFMKAAPVLIAAATIMTVVFAGFASSPLAVVASIAFGLMIGIAADAFLVRMVIMPAVLSIVGSAAWWLPRWLDRIIPSIDMDGHGLEAVQPEGSIVPSPS